jgi:post-segregation antitoxin (ccd killing protein)
MVYLRCDLREKADQKGICLSDLLEKALIKELKKSGKSLPQVE